jgi:hypothetical protein
MFVYQLLKNTKHMKMCLWMNYSKNTKQMKTLILAVALMATIGTHSAFAQDNPKQSLLSSYYDIKNALVSSDAATASGKAEAFLKEISSMDAKIFSAAGDFTSTQAKLSKVARQIAESKDIAKQREYFADFSANFYKLAKTEKLSAQPAYYQYCPMKKAYWLSASSDIKNPYYGKQMLTCGNVKETI